ncbi:MAG: hypothetical protein GXO43_06070 [Crenarchaeota archaeon]|nr:hypothetical protein [Thermoproteota archaeon]
MSFKEKILRKIMEHVDKYLANYDYNYVVVTDYAMIRTGFLILYGILGFIVFSTAYNETLGGQVFLYSLVGIAIYMVISGHIYDLEKAKAKQRIRELGRRVAEEIVDKAYYYLYNALYKALESIDKDTLQRLQRLLYERGEIMRTMDRVSGKCRKALRRQLHEIEREIQETIEKAVQDKRLDTRVLVRLVEEVLGY